MHTFCTRQPRCVPWMQRVVGFQLDHQPDRHSHRRQDFRVGVKLREQCRAALDPIVR
jgi:hypothetical protein